MFVRFHNEGFPSAFKSLKLISSRIYIYLCLSYLVIYFVLLPYKFRVRLRELQNTFELRNLTTLSGIVVTDIRRGFNRWQHIF